MRLEREPLQVRHVVEPSGTERLDVINLEAWAGAARRPGARARVLSPKFVQDRTRPRKALGGADH